jgi:hypothetical protein
VESKGDVSKRKAETPKKRLQSACLTAVERSQSIVAKRLSFKHVPSSRSKMVEGPAIRILAEEDF